MQLVLGSYDGSLIGLQLTPDATAAERRFAYSPHSGCIKALAASSQFLVSAATDERLLVYDIRKKVEFGTLMGHEGTVTCAEFHKNSHLLTGSEDKTVSKGDASTAAGPPPASRHLPSPHSWTQAWLSREAACVSVTGDDLADKGLGVAAHAQGSPSLGPAWPAPTCSCPHPRRPHALSLLKLSPSIRTIDVSICS